MISHQSNNSIGDDLYRGDLYKNSEWGMHYHRGYEFVWVLSGKLCATVANKDYVVHKDQALLITPYALHALKMVDNSEIFIAVFSGAYIGKFTSSTATAEPIDACFTLSAPLCEYLRSQMLIKDLERPRSTQMKKPPLYAIKACLYAICNEFSSVAKWREKEQNNELVFKIISYVEENYAKDITLSTLADSLSYEYHYLSRVLRKNFHIPFRTLLNQCRCERAKEMITSTDLPLSEIADKCGFQSVRSFNRVFSEVTGSTPTSIRKKSWLKENVL